MALQGTVTDLGINDGSGNWTIQIDYGYPSDPTIPMFQNQHLAVFYDGNGHVKQNQSDFNIGPFTSVGAGTFTFPVGHSLLLKYPCYECSHS